MDDVSEVDYLKRLQDGQLLLFAVEFKGHTKDALNAVEPQTVHSTRNP